MPMLTQPVTVFITKFSTSPTVPSFIGPRHDLHQSFRNVHSSHFMPFSAPPPPGPLQSVAPVAFRAGVLALVSRKTMTTTRASDHVKSITDMLPGVLPFIVLPVRNLLFFLLVFEHTHEVFEREVFFFFCSQDEMKDCQNGMVTPSVRDGRIIGHVCQGETVGTIGEVYQMGERELVLVVSVRCGKERDMTCG